jgi:N-acylneuraminate cytidylyltransferase
VVLVGKTPIGRSAVSRSNTIAIIPARGGSKRIPRKNIRDFCGQPVITYSIRTALECGLFNRVVVSTDCDDVAEIATRCGAEVPFRRTSRLADDFSGIEKVVPAAVRALSLDDSQASLICCILATAPMITARDIESGYETIQAGKWDFAVAATEFGFPIQRGFVQQADHGLAMLFPEHYHTRSQDLPRVWHDAGAFYWGTWVAWMEERHLFGATSTLVPIPRLRAIDLDTPEDWAFAEAAHRFISGDRACHTGGADADD